MILLLPGGSPLKRIQDGQHNPWSGTFICCDGGVSHLRFLDVCLIDELPGDGQISEPCCLKALARFRENMQLALVPTTLPGFATWMAMEWISASTKARTDLFGSRNVETLDSTRRNALGSLMESYMFSSLIRKGPDEQKQHLVEKTKMFEKFSADAGPIGMLGLENILKSVVIQSWTAVEVLIEDLLTDAVKEHAPVFSHFNTDGHGFRSRNRFRKAYEKAFTTDYVAIRSHASSVFFDALSLLRNVIVHRASKADDQFLVSAKNIVELSQFHGLNVGDAVEPNGETVRSVVNGSLASSFNLIKSVNDWLRAHGVP